MIPKFRAWLDPDMYDELIIHNGKFYLGWRDFEEGNTYDLAVLMQSTGLKDKNGVEIFEGDVVRYTWDMLTDPNATEKGKKVRISKVFWSDWRASWAVGKKFCNNDLFTYARNGNTVEVIGNIYQNSDLLESVEE
ncbi:YopX family protein [Streptococcus dysgalactiae]|uniref:YopX family protein n=1 Tax=Streptococcus dysgalactiae TaxID=1334 RepID=UPI0001AABBD0|nr:YopX family protein [Streptococcus dysgalactiae]BAH82135.1 hypothetical protein SDEG_1641 [Streptococcus dysgalactiae subsp. equisimilis GGS_124]